LYRTNNSAYNDINTESLVALAKNLGRLEYLKIGNCDGKVDQTKAGDESAIAFARHLPLLAELSAAKCYLGDSGVTTLCANLSNILKLSVENIRAGNNYVGPCGASAVARGLPHVTGLFFGTSSDH
jgi:hypothetical protein